MKLTGKCKKDFEKWYNNLDISTELPISVFQMGLPLSMQYGVYVDFFDSVKIRIHTDDLYKQRVYLYFFTVNDFMSKNDYNTRQEARIKAIEKANEIYNNIKRKR